MKAQPLLYIAWCLVTYSAGIVGKLCVALVPVLLCSLWFVAAQCQAQQNGPRRPAPQRPPVVRSGQDSATIGNSGFKVPIPEIKMRRIVGEQPRRKAPQPPKKEVRPTPQAPSRSSSSKEEMAESPQVPRLPFEPADTRPAVGPRKTSPRDAQESPAEPAPPASEPELPALPPAEELTETHSPPHPPPHEEPPSHTRGESAVPPERPPSTERQEPTPGPELETTSPKAHRPAPDETERRRPPGEDTVQEEVSSVLPVPPAAPEDAVESLPPPEKEILKLKASPAPPAMLRVSPLKGTATIDHFGPDGGRPYCRPQRMDPAGHAARAGRDSSA